MESWGDQLVELVWKDGKLLQVLLDVHDEKFPPRTAFSWLDFLDAHWIHPACIATSKLCPRHLYEPASKNTSNDGIGDSKVNVVESLGCNIRSTTADYCRIATEPLITKTGSPADITERVSCTGEHVPTTRSSSVCSLADSNDICFPYSGEDMAPNEEDLRTLTKTTPKRKRNTEPRDGKKIKEKLKTLQNLLPNCKQVETTSMLDNAMMYIRTLQLQQQMAEQRQFHWNPFISLLVGGGLQPTMPTSWSGTPSMSCIGSFSPTHMQFQAPVSGIFPVDFFASHIDNA